jgi:signal transduction histidine kinase
MKHHRSHLPKPLGQPRATLISASQPWQEAVVGRRSEADASADNAKPFGKSLNDSIQLQNQLQQLTYYVLAAEEDDRKKLSHELQDEIAQTLLAVNVQLLFLKQSARDKAKEFRNEIACAQRLVAKSATLVRRLARELNNHQPTPSDLLVMTI